MGKTTDRTSKYRAGSLSLIGAVALGTGVMIGAGIFALTGQMAEMTGSLFPLAFLSAALIVSFSGVLKDLLAHVDLMVDFAPQGIAFHHCMENSRWRRHG